MAAVSKPSASIRERSRVIWVLFDVAATAMAIPLDDGRTRYVRNLLRPEITSRCILIRNPTCATLDHPRWPTTFPQLRYSSRLVERCTNAGIPGAHPDGVRLAPTIRWAARMRTDPSNRDRRRSRNVMESRSRAADSSTRDEAVAVPFTGRRHLDRLLPARRARCRAPGPPVYGGLPAPSTPDGAVRHRRAGG